jgi:hypothetical protein
MQTLLFLMDVQKEDNAIYLLDFNLIKLHLIQESKSKFYSHNTFCFYNDRLQPTSYSSLSKDTVELVHFNKQFILI